MARQGRSHGYRVLLGRFLPVAVVRLPVEIHRDPDVGEWVQLEFLHHQVADPGSGGPMDSAERIARLIVANARRGWRDERHMALLLCAARQLARDVARGYEVHRLRVDHNRCLGWKTHLPLEQAEGVAREDDD